MHTTLDFRPSIQLVRRLRTLISTAAAVLLAITPGDTQAGTCEGHEVQSLCGNDVLCHFEIDFCGTAIGSVSSCLGAWGQGICTQGNGRVDLGDADFYSQPIFEIECQAVFTHLPGPGEPDAALVSKYVGQLPAASEFWLGVTGDGTKQWCLRGNGTNIIFSPTGSVEEDTLYCVRGVWCEDHGEIYVNGDLVASGKISRNSGNTDTPVIIAGQAGGDSVAPFFGMLDEVRIGCPSTVPPCPTPVRAATWGTLKSVYQSVYQ